jgi:chemotaxis protein MotB
MADGNPIIIKKKKVHGHGHHGGAWKVAYADFVTAMMCFFLVMWIMGMDQETRSMVQGYFNDPFGFMKDSPSGNTLITLPGQTARKLGKSRADGQDPAEQQVEEARVLKSQLQKKLDSAAKTAEELDAKAIATLFENVEMTVSQQGLRIEFVEAAGSVFFESGSTTIRPIALKLIRQIAPMLANSGRKMVVEGHTDAMPYPSQTYNNWDLSTDRANSLRRALQSSGVSGKQFLSVRGFADTELKIPSKPTHFANRRVTILLPFDKAGEGARLELPKSGLQGAIQGQFRPDLGKTLDREMVENRAKRPVH